MKSFQPGILVCYEKHDNVMYWALTQEQLYQHALEILSERFQDGWYYQPAADNSDPEIPLEQIKELPEGSIRTAAMRAYNNWLRNKKQNQQLRATYESIKKTIADENGQQAWAWLQNLSDGEYEQVELVHPIGDIDL